MRYRTEVSMPTATTAEIVGALREHGYVLVRSALDGSILQQTASATVLNAAKLRKMVGKSVNDMPMCFADGADFDPLEVSGMDSSWYFGGKKNYKVWFWENGHRFPNLILKAIQKSILPEVYKQFFGGKALASYEYCTVRYQAPDIRHLTYPFHQDGNYQSRAAEDRTGLTTWIPFVDCGTGAPGLQVVANKFDRILPAPKGTREPILATDTDLVLKEYSHRLWSPQFRAGDVMVFDGFTVHRTYITTEMTEERQSCDFRVFPVAAVPRYVQQSNGWKFEL